ncbi:MAG: hypothetical protein Kow0080_26400 [Candidatus Promineifilaceae bacterium]
MGTEVGTEVGTRVGTFVGTNVGLSVGMGVEGWGMLLFVGVGGSGGGTAVTIGNSAVPLSPQAISRISKRSHNRFMLLL